jgi:predicted nucleic acid-binding protein
MIVVDSSVWIDYFSGNGNPQTNWLDLVLGRQALTLTDMILCEVLQGIRYDGRFSEVRQELSSLVVFDTGGKSLAIATAQNYRFLRQRGYTVRKTIDCYIATFCISGGHSLLHRDRDFDPFEQHLGLRVVHP